MPENQPVRRHPVKVASQTHFKRLGREFAMQYLYLRDMSGEITPEDETKAKELFWEESEQAHVAEDDRVFRKAKNYAEKLIGGVLWNIKDIDSTIESFSEKWDITRMAAVDRNIIRVAIYELKYCPDIPTLVSIDEAIEISKDFAAEKSGIFINGILNGVKDSLPPRPRTPPDKGETH